MKRGLFAGIFANRRPTIKNNAVAPDQPDLSSKAAKPQQPTKFDEQAHNKPPIPKDHVSICSASSDHVPIDTRETIELGTYFTKIKDKILQSKTGSETTYPGRLQVDLQTIIGTLCPDLLSEKLASKIFASYARADGRETIELREFFTGLSSCCRGTTDQKLSYIFFLYDASVTGELRKLDMENMLEAITAIGDIHTTLMRSTSTLLTMSAGLDEGSGSSLEQHTKSNVANAEKLSGFGTAEPRNRHASPLANVFGKDNEADWDGSADAVSRRSSAGIEIPGVSVDEIIALHPCHDPSNDEGKEAVDSNGPSVGDIHPSLPTENKLGREFLMATRPMTGFTRSYSAVFDAANDMIRAFSLEEDMGNHMEQRHLPSYLRSETSLSLTPPSSTRNKGAGEDRETKNCNKSITDAGKPATATPSDEMVTSMLKGMGLSDGGITLHEFLRWIHRNPNAILFLDKIQRITSTVAGHTQRKHLAKEEKNIIAQYVAEHRVAPSEPCYVISYKWWRLWSDYSGYGGIETKGDDESDGDVGNPSPAPDSVDNQDLLREPEPLMDMIEFPLLRNNLMDADYVVVQERVWNALYGWYGGGPAIRRIATELQMTDTRRPSLTTTLRGRSSSSASNNGGSGLASKSSDPGGIRVSVDLYPLVLALGLLTDGGRTAQSKCIASRMSTLAELRGIACRQLNLDPKQPWCFLAYFDETPRDEGVLLSQDETLTLDQAGVVDRQTIVLCLIDNLDMLYTSPTLPGAVEASGDGLIGLKNLGNTCYFSSALQCLSQTRLLREYFLTQQYQKQLDVTLRASESTGKSADKTSSSVSRWLPGDTTAADRVNNGGFVLKYAEFLNQIWRSSRNAAAIAPTQLRAEVVRRSPQFGGNYQQDAQELLGFLLDTMHEELNSVRIKIPIENPDYTGQSDEELAGLCWANHLRRESSIIVSLFQGQFKSHMRCDVCHNEIVKFPPFLFLSLPLPGDMYRVIPIAVVVSDRDRTPFSCTLRVHKDGTVDSIVAALRVLDQKFLGHRNFVVADVQNHYIFTTLKKSKPISEIRERDTLFAYEAFASPKGHVVGKGLLRSDSVTHFSDLTSTGADLSSAGDANGSGRFLKINVIHRRLKEGWRLYGKRTEKPTLYGVPFMLYLPCANEKSKPTARELHDAVAQRIQSTFGLSCVPAASIPTSSSGLSLSPSGNLVGGFRKEKARTTTASDPTTATPTATDKTAAPFVLKHVNRNGTKCSACDSDGCVGCRLAFNDLPLENLGDNDTIAVEWPKSTATGHRSANPGSSAPSPTMSPTSAPTLDIVAKLSVVENLDEFYGTHPENLDVRNAVHLADVIREYEKPECMAAGDEFYCPKCKRHQPGVRRETIYRFPPVLMIQLKRFSYDETGCVKNDACVKIPRDGVDFTPFLTRHVERNGSPLSSSPQTGVSASLPSSSSSSFPQPAPQNSPNSPMPLSSDHSYDLYATINHFGSTSSGHYVALGRDLTSESGKAWNLFNDEQVEEVPEPERVTTSTTAYVLFYERRGFRFGRGGGMGVPTTGGTSAAIRK